MKRGKLLTIAALGLAGSISLGVLSANSQMAPFGGEEDVAYSKSLWSAIEKMGLAGEGAINSFPYEGTEPHGFVLETFYTSATVNGHTGELLVKRNYGPKDVEVEAVQADRAKHLGAVTVMFKREAGYDDDNQNWFWAKYLPDGSLDKNPKGMMLAGKVAKGAKAGCIACHSGAPGDNYIFTK